MRVPAILFPIVDEHRVGASVNADLHPYALLVAQALVGRLHSDRPPHPVKHAQLVTSEEVSQHRGARVVPDLAPDGMPLVMEPELVVVCVRLCARST